LFLYECWKIWAGLGFDFKTLRTLLLQPNLQSILPWLCWRGGFLVNYLPGLTQTVILLISTPQVARIISMTQQCLVSTENLLEFHHRRVFLFLKIPLNSKQKNCKMCNIKTLQGYLNLKYFFYGFSFTSYNQWKQK
jgi:hypothetical protein